ncbi:polysaccharide biosynthesis tyrosine autokinase [Asticcacaulis sp. DW145]|uniref:GumC family protein n=1 Tax=Asticcacaulis sp. DW145 TaxID=3095608 RepID=UPI00308CC106|nr:polysaccharide biosynthesis tyrosine autokinase [Asticcacaulis sp. DW145]
MTPDGRAQMYPQGNGVNAGIDPSKIVGIIRRRGPIFVAVIALLLIAAYGLTYLQPKIYTAGTSLQLDARQVAVLNKSSSEVLSRVPLEASAIATEVAVLQSPDMARRVAKSINLNAFPSLKAQKVSLEDLLESAVVVSRVGQSYILRIEATTTDPKLSRLIAQSYAETYVQKQIQDKVDASQKAVGFLDGRLSKLRDQAQADDRALQEYKIKNNLMSIEGVSLAEQQVSTLSQQLATASADLSEARARRDGALARIRADQDLVEGFQVESDVIKALRSKRAETSAELARLQASYGPRHPSVIRAQTQLNEYDAQINTERNRVLANLNAQVRVAEERYNSLSRSRSSASGQVNVNNAAAVQLSELMRKAEASKTIYESFLNRSREISAQFGIDQPEVRVIADAVEPRSPSGPSLKLNLALALVLGLLISGGYVAVSEVLDQTYRSGREITEELGLKNLTSVPLISLEKGKSKASVLTHVLDQPYSLFTESIRSLRTQIRLAGRTSPVKVIAMTSALPQEGKTLLSLSLARAMAMNGANVLLIDADMRRLSLTKNVGVNPQYGLQDVLTQKARLSDSIIVDKASGADMILVPHKRQISAEVFTNSLFERALEKLKPAYDYIIIDTAPVLALSDIRVIGQLADAVVMVVRWNKTPKDAVLVAKEIIEDSGSNLLGVCLNQVDAKSASYHSYGDTIHYFKDLKQYWSEPNAK